MWVPEHALSTPLFLANPIGPPGYRPTNQVLEPTFTLSGQIESWKKEVIIVPHHTFINGPFCQSSPGIDSNANRDLHGVVLPEARL